MLCENCKIKNGCKNYQAIKNIKGELTVYCANKVE